MSKPVIYTYANCDSCRRAVKWLRARGVEFVEKPIRETPPSPAELRVMLRHQGGAVRKLFNTSGRDYRALGLGEKLAAMDEAGALRLLAGNGNLVKRPFMLGADFGLVGFDEAAWARALGGSEGLPVVILSAAKNPERLSHAKNAADIQLDAPSLSLRLVTSLRSG